MAVVGVTPNTKISIGVIRGAPADACHPDEDADAQAERYEGEATPGSLEGDEEHHPGTDGVVGRLVDEDEAARHAVAPVLVDEQRRGAVRSLSDLVERQASAVSSRWSELTSMRWRTSSTKASVVRLVCLIA